MKRTALTVALTFALGLLFGMVGSQVFSAQHVKRTELLRTGLEGVEGKEAVVYTAELVPGAVAGRHYHPGHEVGYVLEGSLILEREGMPTVTFQAGQVFHNPSKIIHDAKNASMTAPAKVLVFLLSEKGQPLAISVP
jgi:quercetin dioxygenase-like cupin family protein